MGYYKKPKWEGRFNWHGEILVYHTSVADKNAAKILMLKEMAKQVDKPVGILWKMYSKNKDNHKIEEMN